MDKLMGSLIEAFGVSTKEDEIKNILRDEIELIFKSKGVNLDLKEDSIGNLVLKIGEGNEKLMICTHIDNTGLMVMDIDEKGFSKVVPIGKLDLKNISGHFFKSQKGIIGRMGLLTEDSSKEQLSIDFGTSNSEGNIKDGDFLELIGQNLEVENKIIAPNIGSRITTYTLIKVIESIDIEKLDKEIYFVFSVQKELGFKGAKISASNIKPNSAIVLEAMESDDTKDGASKISLGKGTVLSVFDRSLIMHQDIKNAIEKASERLNLKLQYSINQGENQGGVIHKEVGGIKTGTIGIPSRYINTPGEMVSLDDAKNTISLLKGIIED